MFSGVLSANSAISVRKGCRRLCGGLAMDSRRHGIDMNARNLLVVVVAALLVASSGALVVGASTAPNAVQQDDDNATNESDVADEGENVTDDQENETGDEENVTEEDENDTEEDENVTEDEAGDEANASVTFEDQESNGTSVVVDEVTVNEGGFVAIHNSSLLAGDAIGSVIGSSEYLEEGTHEDVEVELNESLEENETLVAMPHQDTNDNEENDFVETEGEEDGPYLNASDEPVIDDAVVTVVEDNVTDEEPIAENETDDNVTDDNETDDNVTDDNETDDNVTDDNETDDNLTDDNETEDNLTDDNETEDNLTDEPIVGNETEDNVTDDNETEDNETEDNLTEDNVTEEDAPEASIMFQQDSDGETVDIGQVTLEEGGFVAVHDSSLLDGNVVGSVIGSSEYLEPGTHESVEVQLDEPLEDDEAVIAMPHLDTNDNEENDFVETEGEEDGPYLDSTGDPVTDGAYIVISDDNATDEPVVENETEDNVTDEEPVAENETEDDIDEEEPVVDNETEDNVTEEEPVVDNETEDTVTDEEPVAENETDEEPAEGVPADEAEKNKKDKPHDGVTPIEDSEDLDQAPDDRPYAVIVNEHSIENLNVNVDTVNVIVIGEDVDQEEIQEHLEGMEDQGAMGDNVTDENATDGNATNDTVTDDAGNESANGVAG
ncbi:DUF7282 domain-containing protein [Halovalidus salilacus]|uniref:DUF7282 domain-containing protein n=1 Tax=Halovalidus salilacus TaxID=3075124 RepID=UPI00387DCB8D